MPNTDHTPATPATTQALGLPIPEVPEGWSPLEVACVVVCMDEDGEERLAVRTTDTLSEWQAMALFDLAARSIRRDVLDDWQED